MTQDYTLYRSRDRGRFPGKKGRGKKEEARRVGDKIELTVTIVAREHYHHGR